MPGFGGLTGRCQFRLYADGETVTFSDKDYFLGGDLPVLDLRGD
jgi:hypothetical protein